MAGLAKVYQIALFSISLFGVIAGAAQPKIRKLPQSINHPSMNVYSPFISLDGEALLYLTDYSEDKQLTVYFTQKQRGDWTTPAAMPQYVNNRLNFQRGYTLSPDSKTIFISSLKSEGGVGGFDIWMADFKGGLFSTIRNPGAPINSKSNDAAPTLTTDGKTMYFMRCEKMTQQSADVCKIFVTKKNNVGQWETPEELPSNINTGNTQFPRIMGDGETLIFASNTMPGMTGRTDMDLYETKFAGGRWVEPKPMDFVNTTKDDGFTSVTANGRYLMKDSPGERKNEIVEYLFPDDLRPKGVLNISGTVKDASGAPLAAYISATNENNQRVFSGRPEANGSFSLYLVEGSSYLLGIDPEKDQFTYFIKPFDLTDNPSLNPEKVEVMLSPVKPGDEIKLEEVRFQPNSSLLSPSSNADLGRLSRIIKSSALPFDLKIQLLGYQEDSVQSSPDLTEIIYDSTHIIRERYDSIYMKFDSTLLASDSTGIKPVTEDTLVIVKTVDTVLMVKIRYHNNRTQKQAEAIISELEKEGVTRSKIKVTTNARPELVADNRRTIISVVAGSQ